MSKFHKESNCIFHHIITSINNIFSCYKLSLPSLIFKIETVGGFAYLSNVHTIPVSFPSVAAQF